MEVNSHASGAFVIMFVLCILLLWLAAWQLVRLSTAALQVLAERLPRSSVLARTHPLRAALRERLPSTYGFVASRLTPHRFDGLPLTLIAVAGLYLVFLLGGLIEDVLEAEEIIRFDRAVNRFIAPWRTPSLVQIFTWITELGAAPALTLVSVVTTSFLWSLGRGYLMLPLWITILGAHATTWFGKFGFDRERPAFVTSVTALSPSFPSAHAAGSMAVLGFVAYLIARDLSRPRQRFEVIFWSLALITLISFSRIFLAVHHTSDIAAGLLVGGFWWLVGFAVAEQLRWRRFQASL
jgi:membrane-associated phospholipid phosphatase